MPKSVAAEAKWLAAHPDFRERPATLLEFLGSDYLDIEARVRDRIKVELANIMGHEVNAEKPTKYELAMITGGIGIGKAQPIETPVLTPKGWRQIGSLGVGDQVIGSNGRPTTVTAVFPQGVRPMYRVTTTDGASTLADPDHLWKVHNFQHKTRGGPPEVLTTQQIVDRGLYTSSGQRKWQIPLTTGPVDFGDDTRLPIHPYALGALLGDGGLTQGAVKFTTADDEILDRLRKVLPDITFKAVGDVYEWRLVTERGQVNPLLDSVRALGIDCRSEFKFIPEPYLFGSVAQRLELLRGLMDTDGFAAKFNYVSFTSASKRLTDDVVHLVRSLGGIATRPTYKPNACLGAWTTTLKTSFCPFHLSRKVARWGKRTANPIVRSIDTIIRADDSEAVCIMVDSPDHLYVTEDFLVTHNSTIGSIVLPYLVHWCLCLKDPQDFFDLISGSRIAFMMMSTSRRQATDVIFSDVKARIGHSPWFKRFPYEAAFKNQLRFENDIWIIPGDSAETTFEGYNILGGILDEADSHKVTKTADYARNGWDTIYNRMSSRFGDRGFLLTIGQMKKSVGFAADKFKELSDNPDAYATRMTIWESRGDAYYACKEVGPHPLNPDLGPRTTCGETHKFAYDIQRKQMIPTAIATAAGFSNSNLLWIPELYRDQFEVNPEKALKDLAGYPPVVGDAFISLVHKVHACRDRWIANYGDESPVGIDGVSIASWFRAQESLKRVASVDIAYSGDGDALGISMGHVREMVEIDGELKPYIVIDLMARMTAPAGGEIFLGNMRHFIYDLRNEYGFKLERITLDGFNSQDSMQQFERRRFIADYVSVDRQVLPYHDLREAIYEDRIEFPPFMVHYRPDDTELTEVLVKELTELVDSGNKIDHPDGGSKDVADTVAAVTFTLMGDRRYHRKVRSLDNYRMEKKVAVGGLSHPAFVGDRGVRAPLPPSAIGGTLL